MKLPPYSKTIAFAAVILVLGVPSGGGHWLMLFVPVLLACMLYALVRLAWKKAERGARAIQFAVWLGTFVALLGAQDHWSDAHRKSADAAAAAVVAYWQRTGAFPARLADAGVTDPLMVYRVNEGKPFLAYPVRAMWLTTYEYDFERKAWTLNDF